MAWKSPSILILHMTKTGDIAGKAELHHACDFIMCMEPAPEHMGNGVRELISYKNRFGPSHQPVYLVMTPTGLAEAPPKEKRKRARRDDALLLAALPESHSEPTPRGLIGLPPPAPKPANAKKLRPVPAVEETPELPRRRARRTPPPEAIEAGGQVLKLLRRPKTRKADNDPPEPPEAS